MNEDFLHDFFNMRTVYPPKAPMRIRVAYSGHQSAWSVTGSVIEWTSTAELFRDTMLQVPAVVLNTGDTIEVAPLRKDLYQVKIEIVR